MDNNKDVTRNTISGGRGVPQFCRYDPHRAALLDAARAKRGRTYRENRSLIVKDALDLFLKTEGLLPEDAPRLTELARNDDQGGADETDPPSPDRSVS